MKLAELEPQFVRRTGHDEWEDVDSVDDADGILFLCPKCFETNGGPRRTHMVLCWRPGVPQTQAPRPGRWEMEGTGYDDLTLVAGSSSVFLKGPGCGAHFFVRDGQIR